LTAAVARAELLEQRLGGAYVPRTSTGTATVCVLAIEIDSWYGVGDERWELSNAATAVLPPGERSPSIREELVRIGVRDCVLDVDR
jgi:hypothetical protein